MQYFQTKENTISIDKEAQRHLNAYIDYSYNVSQYDKAYTPEEYEKFKIQQ